eukprot:m.483423 g.483423  ORF g.483423 m.483423 type:complete len:603 (+) comp57195_c0_seq62:182-1990(+)
MAPADLAIVEMKSDESKENEHEIAASSSSPSLNVTPPPSADTLVNATTPIQPTLRRKRPTRRRPKLLTTTTTTTITTTTTTTTTTTATMLAPPPVDQVELGRLLAAIPVISDEALQNLEQKFIQHTKTIFHTLRTLIAPSHRSWRLHQSRKNLLPRKLVTPQRQQAWWPAFPVNSKVKRSSASSVLNFTVLQTEEPSFTTPSLRPTTPTGSLRNLSHNSTGLKQPATNILIVTSGRTGSTMLSDVLSMIPLSYSFLEPYWGFNSNRSIAPTYEDLFTCNVFQDIAIARKLMWNYECLNDRTLFLFPTGLRERCLAQNLTTQDFKILHEACLRAPFRIVKTIRFDIHFRVKTANPSTRVIFLTRTPWAVIKSQFMLGWHNITVPSVNATEAFDGNHTTAAANNTSIRSSLDLILDAANGTCVHMMNSYMRLVKNLQATPESKRGLAVAYEDLINSPLQALQKIFDFVGAILKPEIGLRIVAQMRMMHGPSAKKAARQDVLTDEHRPLVMALPASTDHSQDATGIQGDSRYPHDDWKNMLSYWFLHSTITKRARLRCSVFPRNSDPGKLPQIRQTNMRSIVVCAGTESEGWQWVKRGPTDGLTR